MLALSLTFGDYFATGFSFSFCFFISFNALKKFLFIYFISADPIIKNPKTNPFSKITKPTLNYFPKFISFLFYCNNFIIETYDF